MKTLFSTRLLLIVIFSIYGQLIYYQTVWANTGMNDNESLAMLEDGLVRLDSDQCILYDEAKINITNRTSSMHSGEDNESFVNEVGPWDLDRLYQTPNWRTSNVDQAEGLTSILYESIDYLGNPVEVYAYYGVPEGTPPAGGWPAVVFAHGGGGTAFTYWVNYWKEKGYAAISMDLEGHYPGTDANGARASTPNPGPSRGGVWEDYQEPIDEQWYYHAVAQIILSHSLIASFPEVNADKIGLMGISWGGNLTSTVMGVDNRLSWAIPIYGAGFIQGSEGYHGRQLEDEEKGEFVSTYYDGRAYFQNVTFPTFWINGTNDFHFALTCAQQSSQAVNGPSVLRYTLGLGHGHTPPLSIDEIYHFANSVVYGEAMLTSFESPAINSGSVSVNFNSSVGVTSASLLYTMDGEDVIWPDKTWNTLSATISGNTLSSSIPSGAYAVFFTATDTRNLMVSSEYTLIDNIDNGAENLALYGTASQSSTAFNGDAFLAIDNNTDGRYGYRSVTHTENTENAWWQVDLGGNKSIDNITIWNRTDACCAARLSNFQILVLDDDGNTVYTRELTNYTPSPDFTTSPGGVVGRYVKVQLIGIGTLSLAEVQVFGDDSILQEPTLVHMRKRNAGGFAIDGNWGGNDEQNIYLWPTNLSNINQMWYEIDRGNGYYSYQKYNTDYCIDGNSGGDYAQSVYLGKCEEANWDQHWKKVDTGGGTYRLEKRNAPQYAIDGGMGGAEEQDVYLWTIGENNQNQQWIFTTLEVPAKSLDAITNDFISVYPIPTDGMLNIGFKGEATGVIKILDISGKVILQKSITGELQTMDVTSLNSGVYIVKAATDKGIFNRKLIKI